MKTINIITEGYLFSQMQNFLCVVDSTTGFGSNHRHDTATVEIKKGNVV